MRNLKYKLQQKNNNKESNLNWCIVELYNQELNEYKQCSEYTSKSEARKKLKELKDLDIKKEFKLTNIEKHDDNTTFTVNEFFKLTIKKDSNIINFTNEQNKTFGIVNPNQFLNKTCIDEIIRVLELKDKVA